MKAGRSPLFPVAAQRRLPVYLLLDCSTSMEGQALTAVEHGVKILVENLRDHPCALETVWLGVIAFSGRARVMTPLTPVDLFEPPALEAGGDTALGPALRLLEETMTRDLRRGSRSARGDFRPLVFLMTDGAPNVDDDWRRALAVLQPWRPRLVACGAGAAVDLRTLREMTPDVLSLRDLTPSSFAGFFQWVSQSVRLASTRPEARGTVPFLGADGELDVTS